MSVENFMVETLKKRQDFLALRTGKKSVRRAFVLQGRKTDSESPLRIGYTASKTIGNAVKRARAKRRLRAAVTEIFTVKTETGRKDRLKGHDFVLIARQDILTIEFAALCQDLQTALNQINRP